MCAGTYGHKLLRIGASRSFEIRCALDQGDEASKPGWLRISFSPATSPDEFAVLLDAVVELAERWRDWADDYTMDPVAATWRRKGDAGDDSTANRALFLAGPPDGT